MFSFKNITARSVSSLFIRFLGGILWCSLSYSIHENGDTQRAFTMCGRPQWMVPTVSVLFKATGMEMAAEGLTHRTWSEYIGMTKWTELALKFSFPGSLDLYTQEGRFSRAVTWTFGWTNHLLFRRFVSSYVNRPAKRKKVEESWPSEYEMGDNMTLTKIYGK